MVSHSRLQAKVILIMSELEALNWLKARYEYNLTKSGDFYALNMPGRHVHGESLIDCVIKLKKELDA